MRIKKHLGLVLAAVILFSVTGSAYAQVTTHAGSLPDGATYLIEVPSPWNGTLLLYSHALFF